MSNNFSEELLKFYESMLRAQLNTIKQLRKSAGTSIIADEKEKRMSQMDIVYDILQTEHKPLHVDDIIALAQQRFNLSFDKESLVSALSKRIKRQDRFIKTAPNTFSLL